MSLESRTTSSEARQNLVLWMGFLAGPLAWSLQLETTYALAPRACGGKGKLLLHLATLACLLLVGGGSWAAWTRWGAVGRRWPSDADEGMTARVRFMGAVGLMACLLFALIIVAEWIAIAVLDPCPA